jgi:hypothetical protein
MRREKNSMQKEQTVSRLGATLRDVTRCAAEEPLPAEMVALLMLLEQVEEERAKQSHNLSHWTSRREPKKS